MPTYNKLKTATKKERGRNRVNAIALGSIMAILVVTGGLTALIVAITNDNERRPTQEVSTAIVFGLPVSEFNGILKNSSLTEHQWNDTMLRWESHKGVTIDAPLGSPVIATFAGTVTSIVDSTFYGRQVTIEHRDGLKTVFSNLATNTAVTVGQRVEKGARLGYVGQTRNIEFHQTPHLHVQVYRDGRRVNPNDFIDFPEK